MTEHADPIPNELRQAFHEIALHVKAWRPPLPEIELHINGTYQPMSEVCKLVSTYNDALPKEVHEHVLSALRAHEFDRALHTEQPILIGEIAQLLLRQNDAPSMRQLEARLAAECNYKTASFCLLKLFEAQRARFLARTKARQ